MLLYSAVGFNKRIIDAMICLTLDYCTDEQIALVLIPETRSAGSQVFTVVNHGDGATRGQKNNNKQSLLIIIDSERGFSHSVY